MYQMLIKRHIYQNRYQYIFSFLLFMTAFIAGLACASRVYAAYSLFAVIAASILPIILISVGGLFFMGVFLSAGVIAYAGYMDGALVSGMLEVSFWSGAAYIFFILLPCSLPRLAILLYMAVNSFNSNKARIILSRKGLKRRMNSYEINEHFAKLLFSSGVILILSVLEYYVFSRAMGLVL